MSQRGRVKVEQGHKRVRAMVAGETVVDSRRPLLVWEKPYYPTYYFPPDDVRMDLLVETAETRKSPSRGVSHTYNLKTQAGEVPAAAWMYPDSAIEEISGYVAFKWREMDHWFEEDEEVFVHARDPYTRVDILRSSRHVKVSIGGEVIAESSSPALLFETGLPTRYYLPPTDVRWDLLEKTDHRTECPYKGVAEYWSVRAGGELHENIVWSYPFPTLESAKIAGLICFYDEKVDTEVDGRPQERPRTPFA